MKVISILASIAFVGLVAYWVIKASLPLPAPEVTYSVLPENVRAEVSVPYSCDKMIRVFRSENEGVSWDRITPSVYRAEDGKCVLPDMFANMERGVTRLLYRYASVDARRDVSRWSNITAVPFSE